MGGSQKGRKEEKHNHDRTNEGGKERIKEVRKGGYVGRNKRRKEGRKEERKEWRKEERKEGRKEERKE